MMKVILFLSLALVHVEPHSSSQLFTAPHSSALSALHALVKEGAGTAGMHPPAPHAATSIASIAFTSIASTSIASIAVHNAR